MNLRLFLKDESRPAGTGSIHEANRASVSRRCASHEVPATYAPSAPSFPDDPESPPTSPPAPALPPLSAGCGGHQGCHPPMRRRPCRFYDFGGLLPSGSPRHCFSRARSWGSFPFEALLLPVDPLRRIRTSGSLRLSVFVAGLLRVWRAWIAPPAPFPEVPPILRRSPVARRSPPMSAAAVTRSGCVPFLAFPGCSRAAERPPCGSAPRR